MSKIALITGVAGFIGSNLLEKLINSNHFDKIIGIDNLSTGKITFIDKYLTNKKFVFIKEDLLNFNIVKKNFKSVDTVFHLAALADVRNSYINRINHYKNNIEATQNIIELAIKYKIKQIFFTSTGSVYGNQKIRKPFGETDFFPIQNSFYGAAKISSEALLTSLSFSHNIKISILRLVSILGKNYTHGHLIDFYKKFKNNKKVVNVLGNGLQNKSYLNVLDLVSAIDIIYLKQKELCEVYNIGLNETKNVKNSIKIFKKRYNYNHQVIYENKSKGWIGDNPYIRLKIEKILNLGWRPQFNINQSINHTLDWLDEYIK